MTVRYLIFWRVYFEYLRMGWKKMRVYYWRNKYQNTLEVNQNVGEKVRQKNKCISHFLLLSGTWFCFQLNSILFVYFYRQQTFKYYLKSIPNCFHKPIFKGFHPWYWLLYDTATVQSDYNLYSQSAIVFFGMNVYDQIVSNRIAKFNLSFMCFVSRKIGNSNVGNTFC